VAIAAIVLPVTSLAILTSTGTFAGAAAPEYPVVCKLAATVTFSPSLTKSGTDTTDRSAVTTMTISSGKFSGCLSAAPIGAAGHGTLPTTVVTIPATNIGKVDGVKTYATGYCPTFSGSAPGSTSLKDTKHVVFDITWAGGGVSGTSVFTTKSTGWAVNTDSEVGFNFLAKAGTGLYAESSLDQITAYFDPTDSSAIATGCSSDQTVSSATFDDNNSVGIL
jgi:hypothetical protein